MPLFRSKESPRPTIAIAPMIDCVFLLLIYFMVTSTLERQEADISFQLPGTVEQTESLEMPDEQIIEILADGQVIVNEFAYDSPNAPRLMELAAMLSRFREANEANQTLAMVTVSPDPEVLHQMIIKVMDACAIAGIESVNFAIGER